MQSIDFDDLVKRLTARHATQRLAARIVLLSLQENAVDGLADVYYAGANDETALEILDVIAEIGGPYALTFLRNVFTFEDERLILKSGAAQGLLRNGDNLSHDEVQDIALYLAGAA